MYDLLIKNGDIFDGTGSTRYRADIAVQGNTIARLGNLNGADAVKVIDAGGLAVAPGFIDAHTHDDRLLLSSPQMAPKVSQGVTTIVGGNCGVSLAPLKGIDPPPPMNLLGGQEWYRFSSVREYRDELETAGTATNCAMLVGHSTLRAGTMKALGNAATNEEIDTMKNLMVDALEDGCIGLSTGLDYPTASAAPTGEIVSLARELAGYNAMYVSHIRDEGDSLVEAVAEGLEIGRTAEVPMVISHHKAAGHQNWGKTRKTLKMINQAKREQSVHFDVYPYIASSSVLLMQFIETADKVKLTWSGPFPEMGGVYLDKICRQWGCDLETAVQRLQPAGAIYFEMDESEMQSLLKQPGTMVGSDGLPHDLVPHPRLWGTFPRVVGYYARELGLFSVEQAIHQMTGLTASVFGLEKRGEIKIGNYADLVIFDESKIIDVADFDNPDQPSAGIHSVYVNGRPVWANGTATGSRPGKWLRRGPA